MAKRQYRKDQSNGQMDQSQRRKSRKSRNSGSAKDTQLDDRNLREEKDYKNDPTWYAQTPELMQLSANIPFSQAAGTSFDLDFYNDAEGAASVKSNPLVVPGIMTMNMVPVPSSANGPTSPLNIAATSVFSFVRHANSGTPQYNSPDLMIYCLAMGQVYSYINYLQRVYGCMNLYANMNRYLPRALVEVQGVNFNNIQQNLPNFKYGIDTLIHKAASLAVPASMTYFRRLAFLFSGIYAEGETIKDQLYMYVPAGFMQFSETASENGGSLQYKSLWNGVGVNTYTDLIDFGNQLLDPILSSEDMNIMSGDILKAYGDAGILKLQTLPEVYVTSITTDLTVLEQFQNAGTVGSLATCKIEQSQKGLAGSLVSTVTTVFDSTWVSILNAAKPLTTILTNPTAADVMERTRLMTYGYQDDSSGTTVNRIEMATEVPLSISLWEISPSTGQITGSSVPQYNLQTLSPTAIEMQNALNLHCKLENFKFHPALYYFTRTSELTSFINVALDFDNYAIVNVRDLQRMNEAALLSMFNVNSVAKAY